MNRQEVIAQLDEARATLAECAKAVDQLGDPFALTLQARTLLRVIELDPGNWAPHYHLGKLYAKINQPQESMKSYNSAVLHDLRLGGDEKVAEKVYRLLGAAWEQAGDGAQALIQYGRFVGSYPLSIEVTPILQRMNDITKTPSDWFQLFQEGARAQRLKDHTKASEKLNLCVRRLPSFAPAWFRLGVSYRAQQQTRPAVDAYANAIRYDPHPRYYVELGSIYEATKNQHAPECYRTALQYNPDEALAHAQLGLLLFNTGHKDEAYAHLERAVRIAPDGTMAERCWEALHTFTHPHAHATASAATQLAASFADEHVRWTDWDRPQDGLVVQYPHWSKIVPSKEGEMVRFVDRDAGRTVVTLRWIAVEGAKLPQNVVRGTQAQMIRTRQTIFDGVGIINVQGEHVDVCEVGDTAKNEATFLAHLQRGQELLELKANAPLELYARLRHTFIHMVKSWQVMSEQDLVAQQMQQLEAAVKEKPDDPFVIAALADKLTEIGEYDAAAQTYQRLMKLQPKFTNAHVGLALCSWKQGRADLAMKHLENAVAIRPEPRSLSLLVTLYENEGQVDRGAKVMKKALSQDPNNAELRAFMGNYYFARRDLKNAEAQFVAAYKLNPKDWELCHQLGALYSQLKRPVDALPYLRRARDQQPRPDSDTLLMLGLCELQCQHIEEAEKALQDVMALDYNNETALDALTAIAEAREKAITGNTGKKQEVLMPTLSDHLRGRQPSDIRIAGIKYAARRDGTSAINVAIGNVSLPMHPAMIERMQQLGAAGSLFADGVVKYTATVGSEEARQAFLNVIGSSGCATEGLHCQITDGGSQAMELLILATCGRAEGCERPLLLIDAAYTNYVAFAKRLRIPIVSIARTLRDDGKFTLPPVDDIERLIREHRPGALVVIPYDNPTGHFYDRDTMRSLARLCVEHDLWMISDEAYRELFYTGDATSSVWALGEHEVPGISGRRVSIETASKVWNACGLRIGALVTDSLELHTQCVAENTASLCSSAIGQHIFGALAHESHADLANWYGRQRAYYRGMMERFADSMRAALPQVIVSSPDAAIYSVVEVRNYAQPGFKALDFALWCAAEGVVEHGGEKLTLLVAPMAGFYNCAPSQPNPGATQLRIAYVEPPPQMLKVPGVLAELLRLFEQQRSSGAAVSQLQNA